MAETFLVHMDDFERRLDRDLANMLDPIVRAPAPRRRRPRGANPLKAIRGGLSSMPGDVVMLAEAVPVPIAVPVAPLS